MEIHRISLRVAPTAQVHGSVAPVSKIRGKRPRSRGPVVSGQIDGPRVMKRHGQKRMNSQRQPFEFSSRELWRGVAS